MKQFVFLYPTEEYLDFELDKGICFFGNQIPEEKEAELVARVDSARNEEEKASAYEQNRVEVKQLFSPVYSHALNSCIHHRYRRKGFQINYAVFSDREVSDIISLRDSDRVFSVGMSFKRHTTKVNGKYPYPNNNYILRQIGDISELVVAGFHAWDCVEKLAKRAYGTGFDVFVDEDLTEFFPLHLFRRNFRIKSYPTYKPPSFLRDAFFEARKKKPWLFKSIGR